MSKSRTSIEPSSNEVTDLLNVLLGGLLAVLAGVVANVVLARMERDREQARRRRDHAGAARAIQIELASNRGRLETALRQQSMREFTVTTSAYDGLILPLFSLIEAKVGVSVASAYAYLPAAEKSWDYLWLHKDDIRSGDDALTTYVKTVLGRAPYE
jgi:hypothetical protein